MGPRAFINQSALELSRALGEERLARNDRTASALAENAREAAAQQGASPAEQRQAASSARELAEAGSRASSWSRRSGSG